MAVLYMAFSFIHFEYTGGVIESQSLLTLFSVF